MSVLMILTWLACISPVKLLIFSVRGLQLKANQEFTLDTMLNITIGIGDPFAMYLLRGEVCWMKCEMDEYFMGVLLLEEDSTTWILGTVTSPPCFN
ncbi:MAG: hypothetical protein CMQ19_08750 [Gammaproteobacteria bacterium]|nr:hypothetical protein [Gammaproteobacteria bacterium]